MITENILLFKSNIKTVSDRFAVERILDIHPQIDQWTIDQQDEDCVLRVISERLTHKHIIDMVAGCGYRCEEMTD